MKCTFCGESNSRVVDSRPIEEGATIRRRRLCTNCGRRFTTYERAQIAPVIVIKRDGSRESFDVAKVRRGIGLACENCELDSGTMDELAIRVEHELYDKSDQEITSQEVGELVLQGLLGVSEVGYIRFASVFHRFGTADQFSALLRRVAEESSALSESAPE